MNVKKIYEEEMKNLDKMVGEFRVNYEGLLDKGLGKSDEGGKGRSEVMEVRRNEVKLIMENGKIVGRIVYENMMGKKKEI